MGVRTIPIIILIGMIVYFYTVRPPASRVRKK